jgi:hypothetical protein
MSLPRYIERKIEPITECGCWVWMGALDKDGYGKTSHTASGLKRHVRSHRIVYELLVGPIPAGTQLRHQCDNPCCVNPDHMLLGNQADNIADREKRGRTSRGEKHLSATVTAKQVLAIRAATGRLSDIAAAFGITASHAWLIRDRRIWKHV